MPPKKLMDDPPPEDTFLRAVEKLVSTGGKVEELSTSSDASDPRVTGEDPDPQPWRLGTATLVWGIIALLSGCAFALYLLFS